MYWKVGLVRTVVETSRIPEGLYGAIGASRAEQLEENVAALESVDFSGALVWT